MIWTINIKSKMPNTVLEYKYYCFYINLNV